MLRRTDTTLNLAIREGNYLAVLEPGSMPPRIAKVGDLHTEQFVPDGAPKGVVVVSHGYAEHAGRYRELAGVITAAGWAALSYDVRGHGQSPGQRGYIDRFAHYLDDLTAMIAAATPLAPGAPVVLLGHSHGSLITLRALAGDRPPAVAAAIVSSPFLGLRLRVPGYRKLLAAVASKVAPRLAQPNALRVEDLTADLGKQAERRADALCFDVATARWFTEASIAQAYVAAHAARIAVPTTWLIGGSDPIADPARSREIARRVPGAVVHDYPTLRHEVFNETTRSEVFAEVTRALDAAASR